MAAQDRDPPSGDVTSLDPVAEVVARLTAGLSAWPNKTVISSLRNTTLGDLRNLLAAYAARGETIDELWRQIAVYNEDIEQLGFGGAAMGREIESLRSKLDLAVKALEPFAEKYGEVMEWNPGKDLIDHAWVECHWKHYRTAGILLTEMRKT